MRYLVIGVFVLLPSFAGAGPRGSLRPLDTLAEETLARAIDGSMTVRTLVTRLDASNVIVHIESSRVLPLGIGGMTRFVTTRGGFRYLRITIGTDLPDRARAAILGHELQHACEVAESKASDAESLRGVFEHKGYGNGGYFETAAAIQTERSVRLELQAGRASLQAEPVVKFDH